MDRSYRYTRRLEQRARLARPLTALAIGVAGCAMAFALISSPDPIAASVPATATSVAMLSVAAPAARPNARRVYPYSVVPGGVASQAELVRIVRSDKVVATHYASFDVSHAREVTVGKPRAVHVSYRKGDKVYWTAKKVMLREGETLLSDGKNEMRTRCANRVSDVAQFPVEAHGPSAELLDTAYEAEEGSLQNASAAMAEEGELPSLGQQPQLPALTNASASVVASTTIDRTAGTALGSMPSFAGRLGTGPLTQRVPAATPGAPQQAQDLASSGGLSSAPALVVATDVTESDDATSVATQPELAATPKPGSTASTMPAMPATAGEEKPRPTELPEPGTVWLIALALGSMLLLRNKS
jgi:hypothetical protein